MTGGEWRVGNVPARERRLVGRQVELAEVMRVGLRSRLVTLTGVAGVGKTRLAQEAAAVWQPGFRDGVWWVKLSPLTNGALLAHTIAGALPLADQTARPMIDVLADYLADRQLLLVLDTCEHLTDACALVVEALLRAAPGLRVLVTSRRLLGMVGEEVFTVEPLPVPAADAGADAVDGVDAVALLAARAAEAVPGFAVTEANRAEVVGLCRRLEGLPLALELAAARLREWPVAELARRLEDRFAVLGETNEAVDGAEPPWHQALRTAIGWSHQLCRPSARLLWARLSVFAGSFDAEAARQVCADEHLPEEQIGGLLKALVDKSILAWEPTGVGARHRMLDTIREYGTGWLHRLGEEGEFRRRHRDYYRALARQADAAWLGPDQYAWYDRVTAEHDNLRTALEFSLAEPEDHRALELAGSLWFLWYIGGFAREGRHYLDRALAVDTEPSPARVKALFACGWALFDLGDLACLEARAAECAAEAARFGDTEADLTTTVAIAAAALRGAPAQTVPLCESLLAAPRREERLTFPVVLTLSAIAHAHLVTGRAEEAVTVLDELRATCDRHGELVHGSWGNFMRAQAELALGRLQTAQEYARAALVVKHRVHDSVGKGMCLDVLAQATVSLGQAERAARLLGLAQQVWDTLGQPQFGIPALVAAHQACEQQTRHALGDNAYETAFRTGYDTDPDTGIAYALHDAPPSQSPTPRTS